MGHTYTLTTTTLIGPCRRFAEFAHQLLSWTCCLIPFSRGLLVSFISISNILIRVHVIVGLSTNASIKTMIIISGSLYIYIFQYFYQSCNILCMQYISPCISSINLGNVVIISKIGPNENFSFKSLIFMEFLFHIADG